MLHRATTNRRRRGPHRSVRDVGSFRGGRTALGRSRDRNRRRPPPQSRPARRSSSAMLARQLLSKTPHPFSLANASSVRTAAAPRRRDASTSGTPSASINASLMVSFEKRGSPRRAAKETARVDFPLPGGPDTITNDKARIPLRGVEDLVGVELQTLPCTIDGDAGTQRVQDHHAVVTACPARSRHCSGVRTA